MQSLSGGARYEPSHSRGPALPPIHPPTSEPTPPRSEGRTPRALGVHSILNPSAGDGGSHEPKGLRRTASQMESPSPIDRLSGPSPHFGQPGHHEDPRRAQALGSSTGSQRRVLSPRSPIYRSQSMNMIRPPTGTINAQETPFLSPSSQDYRHEPGSAPNPPLPTPPAAQRSGYNFPPPPPSIPTPPIQQSHSRRTSGGVSQPPQPQSASASPRGMYSYGPAGQHSPATPLGEIGRPSPVPFQPAPSSAPAPPQFSSQEPDRSYGIPVASTGQSNYQLLTLETNQGHVQIPVDVQAASKMADEKRKRNAGASARFRARRKEKEREASTTISRLEQQVREANEDIEYYKRERDYFAQLVYQAPGGDRHFPRPHSPRSRRLSMQAQGSTGASSGQGSASAGSTPGAGFPGYPPDQRSDQRPSESDRNVRRRTSSYLPPPGAASGQQAQPQVGYPPGSYPPLAAASPAPGSRTPSGSMQHGPPQQPPPQPGYPTPYGPERTDRSWPPQPPTGRGPPLPPPGQH
ncbi:hypothetical protein SLS56_004594 [Neofusicoccum ribis]|uniref:BZIP domain-containing protein n=1 Tax=Neofusicoccum ribis TaxID=45134 RepID=A0ABR3SVX3_9PEZI